MNRFGFYERPNKTRDNNYTVQKGDTLYKIAMANGVNVDELMKANNLTDTQIYPNQIIVIPVRVGNGSMYFEEYIIEPNETISEIASKLNIDTEAISKYNDITKLVLLENQIIKIPKQYNKHTIVSTDTLDSILKQYNMTLQELVQANYDKWLAVGKTINVK